MNLEAIGKKGTFINIACPVNWVAKNLAQQLNKRLISEEIIKEDYYKIYTNNPIFDYNEKHATSRFIYRVGRTHDNILSIIEDIEEKKVMITSGHITSLVLDNTEIPFEVMNKILDATGTTLSPDIEFVVLCKHDNETVLGGYERFIEAVMDGKTEDSETSYYKLEIDNLDEINYDELLDEMMNTIRGYLARQEIAEDFAKTLGMVFEEEKEEDITE